MSAKRLAFPVMDAVHATTTRMVEVSQDRLPGIRRALQRRAGAAGEHSCSGPRTVPDDGCLRYTLGIGEYVTLPLTVVGAPLEGGGTSPALADGAAGDGEEALVHAPGLPGAFPVRVAELVHFRGRLTPSTAAASPAEDEASVQLGSLCLMDALGKHGQGRKVNVLDNFYRRGRRGCLACAGSASLLAKGDELNAEGLQLDFPYHCGGAQATKRFVDATSAACTHFSPHAAHGTKVLSRYGIAVSVGVAVDDTMGVPCLFWHPSGAPAACLSPVLHGCRLLPVGAVKLAYSGPTSRCEVLQHEDPRRYMNVTVDDRYDCTAWLTEGLFGVRPGDAWRSPAGEAEPGSLSVLGVGYDEGEREFELFLRNEKTGAICPAGDV